MGPDRRQRVPRVLSIEAGSRLQLLFISSILTVLVVRFYLHLTGYPQVSSGELHIAHLLWGGLLMLIGGMMLLSYLGRRAAAVAAVVTGIGFGLFIDEMGKFITKDNDYFYRPAMALIYVVFVLLYFAIRSIKRRQELTPAAALANALDLAKDAIVHGWSQEEKAEALRLLRQSNPDDPFVTGLYAALVQIPTATPTPSTLATGAARLGSTYRRLVQAHWFRWLALAICIVKIGEALGWTATVIIQLGTSSNGGSISFFDLLTVFGTIVGVVPILYGLWLLHRGRRLQAFALFKQTAFLSFFLVTFLSFYWNQFGGVLDLGLNLAVLGALQCMINQERQSDPALALSRPDARRPGHPQLS